MRLDLLSPSGDWFRARFKGTEGCIHKSAVLKTNVSLSGLKGAEKRTQRKKNILPPKLRCPLQVKALLRRWKTN